MQQYMKLHLEQNLTKERLYKYDQINAENEKHN